MRKKTMRIDLRVDEFSKRILSDAAELSDLSLSAYILSVALKQARRDMTYATGFPLPESDAKALLDEMSSLRKKSEQTLEKSDPNGNDKCK